MNKIYIYEYNNTWNNSYHNEKYYYNGIKRPINWIDTCPDYILINTTNNNTFCNKTCDGGIIYKVEEQNNVT